VPGDPPPLLLLLDEDPLTVMVCARVDCLPQLFVYVAVAVQDAVGLTVCVREVPEVPQPLHDQPGEAHSAPHDELVDVVRELAERTPNGAVLIDNVARTLKARGFSRPPGSPRLVTRLRRIKELMVSPTGMITLVSGGSEHAAEPEAPEIVGAPVEATPEPAAPAPARRRRSRRGGRRRRRPAPATPGA